MKVYLDACCFGRLTDDQSQGRIRTEAEAVERILALVQSGEIELVSSEALEEELRRNPSTERRIEAQALLSLAAVIVRADEAVTRRAGILCAAGYGVFDALHLAAAESADAGVLLSADDRFVSRAARGDGNPRTPVRNPVSWVMELKL